MQHEKHAPVPTERPEPASKQHNRRPSPETVRQESSPPPAPQQLARDLRSL